MLGNEEHPSNSSSSSTSSTTTVTVTTSAGHNANIVTSTTAVVTTVHAPAISHNITTVTNKGLRLDALLSTTYCRSQKFLSRQLAQLHPDLTMPMFSGNYSSIIINFFFYYYKNNSDN